MSGKQADYIVIVPFPLEGWPDLTLQIKVFVDHVLVSRPFLHRVEGHEVCSYAITIVRDTTCVDRVHAELARNNRHLVVSLIGEELGDVYMVESALVAQFASDVGAALESLLPPKKEA